MNAENIEGFLTQRVVGPVPMWALIGVGGGVILLLFKRGGGGGGGSSGETAPDLPSDTTAIGSDRTGEQAGPIDYGAIAVPSGSAGAFEDPMPSPIMELPSEPVGNPNPDPYDPITPVPPIVIDPPTLIGPWPVEPTPDQPTFLPILAPIAQSLISKGVDPATGAFIGGGSVSSGPGGANAVGFGGTVDPIYPGTAAVATPTGMTAGGFFHASEGIEA